MKNSNFWTRNTSLYGSQTSPVSLCMQYSVISTRMTGLYGFRPSSAVLYIQNSGFRTIETNNADVNQAILHAQHDRLCLGPIGTCSSGPKVAVLHPKTTDEGWESKRLVFLMLITLFCLHKTTGEVWDPYRFVILVQKSQFCMQKPQMRSGTHRALLFWC